MTTDNATLEPCPWCQQTTHLLISEIPSADHWADPRHVVCTNPLHSPAIIEGPSGDGETGAAEAWNTRTLPPAGLADKAVDVPGHLMTTVTNRSGYFSTARDATPQPSGLADATPPLRDAERLARLHYDAWKAMPGVNAYDWDDLSFQDRGERILAMEAVFPTPPPTLPAGLAEAITELCDTADTWGVRSEQIAEQVHKVYRAWKPIRQSLSAPAPKTEDRG